MQHALLTDILHLRRVFIVHKTTSCDQWSKKYYCSTNAYYCSTNAYPWHAATLDWCVYECAYALYLCAECHTHLQDKIP